MPGGKRSVPEGLTWGGKGPCSPSTGEGADEVTIFPLCQGEKGSYRRGTKSSVGGARGTYGNCGRKKSALLEKQKLSVS